MAESQFSYRASYLRVDLTSSRITTEGYDSATLRLFPGGTGMGTKILYEEVPPGVGWSDPENRFVVATGPLGGTRVPGSGTVSVVTKGALTDGAAACQANGFMGAFLRQNGYDGIIIHGAAPSLSYLYIHDGEAEICDATHLAGVDTWDMIDRVAEEVGQPTSRLSVFGVGLAGENLSRFAAFVGDRGHVAGHNGTGAVLGSKRLKAIVVRRGEQHPPIHEPDTLAEVAQRFREHKNEAIARWGTLRGVAQNARGYGLLPVKNYSTSVWDISDEQLETWDGPFLQENFAPQRHNCWACSLQHCTMMTIPDGPHQGFVGEEPEYEQFAAFGPVIDNKDAREALFLANQCDRLGFENNEMGWLIGMVMECYESGVLTQEQLGGLEMCWGNTEATYALMRMIAQREGIGDLLAEGVKRAAEAIGGPALDLAVYTKRGNSPRGHDHRARWTEMLDTATSDSGTMAVGPMFNNPPETLDALGVANLPGQFEPDEVAGFNAKTSGVMHFEDCLGTCRFNTQSNMVELVKAVNAATGWDVTLDEGRGIGLRAMNLMRAFNLRHGVGPERDGPSHRYGSTPVDGPSAGKAIAPHWDRMVSEFYRQIGWDESGMPTRKTLESLGLSQAADDLDLA